MPADASSLAALSRHPAVAAAWSRVPEGWRAAVMQSPAKSGTLGALLLVLAVVGGKTLLGGGGPTPARGAPAAKPAAGDAGKAGATLAPAERSAADVEGHAALVAWASGATPAAGRNLFVFDPELFPPADPSAPPPVDDSVLAQLAAEADRLAQLAKSRAAEADEQRRRQDALALAADGAARLRLSATVLTGRPAAVIDGRLVRPGDAVGPGGAFRLKTVEARRATVERDGTTFAVELGR